MNRARVIVLPLLAMLLLASCSVPKPSEVSRLEAYHGSSTSKVNNIRVRAVKETALSLGARAGLAWRSQQINQVLLHESAYLNRVFNFNALLLDHDVLPPVLDEANNSVHLASADTLRLADKVYKIVSPPRFVTATPNWRNYLWMDYKKPTEPNTTLLPRTREERDMWNQYIQEGWIQGIKQAEDIFSTNLGRLKRDYQGMVIYRQLLAQNMVSPPYVAGAELGITGGGNQMRVGDQVLRITATSQLIANSKQWKPALGVNYKTAHKAHHY